MRKTRSFVFSVSMFFELENAAIGTYVPPEGWSDASGHESEAIPDPEEEAEQNVLAAEEGRPTAAVICSFAP